MRTSSKEYDQFVIVALLILRLYFEMVLEHTLKLCCVVIVLAGPLKQMAARAAAAPESDFVLLIDELNRANVPKVLESLLKEVCTATDGSCKVFGELFYLLEYRERSVQLLYSSQQFSLPPNLYIIATM
jgi:5-methylcytosine-specific restriction endonuclease McrBC GTP-binding regulatory subunit McrB